MIRKYLAISGLVLLAGAGAAQAGDTVTKPGLLERCWTPAELASKPVERASQHHHAKLDMTTLHALEQGAAASDAQGRTGTIRRVKLPPDQKLIALTFDLCETQQSIAGYDGTIIDYLRENGIRATFFVSGKWFETHAERAQQLIADDRFEIGNHGFEHRDFRKLRGAALHDEIELTQAAYRHTRSELAGKACFAPRKGDPAPAPATSIWLLRFPFGTCDTAALKAVADAGLLAIQWDVVTGDPDRKQSAAQIARAVLANAKPGSIVVAHANGRGWHMAQALPLIIPKLKEQGYRFVTVSELIAAGEPEFADTCYERRPGDSMHVNRPPRKHETDKNAERSMRALLQFPN